MWAGTRSPWEPPDQKDGLLAGPPFDLAPLPRAEHTCCRPYWAQLPPPTLPIKKAPSSQPFARTRESVVREAAHHRATDPNSDPHHHIARDAEHLVEEHQPAREAEHKRDQRPGQAGGHGRALTPAAARAGAGPASSAGANPSSGSNHDRLRQDRSVRLAGPRNRHGQVVLEVRGRAQHLL